MDKDIQRIIDADLEDWMARKHQAVFHMEDGDDAVTVGSLWIDGKPYRPGFGVENHWVTMTEAQRVAQSLEIPLRVA